MTAAARTLGALVAQRAATMAVLRDGQEALSKAQTSASQTALAAFDAPVLEHLRQSNHAAYEAMLSAMQQAIDKVLRRA